MPDVMLKTLAAIKDLRKERKGKERKGKERKGKEKKKEKHGSSVWVPQHCIEHCINIALTLLSLDSR
jgi:hypothetical protein